ncbi:L,D-transpeptidase [Massilia sp.]|uniref:L,D-transpeptidase family protein n=1 Tax=Massilia sp. TaxID=1882437 RepID=UPI0028AB4133|nr:L,D-transpeptidase [Massilia sp.]
MITPIVIAVLAGALPVASAQVAPAQNPPAVQPGLPNAAPLQAAQQPAPADAGATERAEFERLLRAQVLLDRLHLSPGEIDGAYGSNMRQALTTFQQTRNLEATGKLDDATWNALNQDTTPTLTTYVLTNEDVAGPFQKIPEDMMDKAKLDKLGYASPLEGLGEKFHASPDLLARLNPGKTFSRAGEQIVVPSVHGGAPLPQASKVVVSDSRKVLMLYDASDRLVAQYPASTGSEHDPLPIGNWKIEGVHPNPTYHYNPKLFWDASPGDKKTTIAAGPNNPVGVAWIDLSKPHYGIHGTPVPKFIGKTESHGCIRLTNWSAAEVAQVVAAGTNVVLQE